MKRIRPWKKSAVGFPCLFGLLSSVSAEPRSFRGITEPVSDVTMSATVAGRVAVVYVKEGAAVKKGDTLLDLEKEEQELEAARRKLIADSQAEILSAKKQMEVARMDATATQELFKATRSVSEEEVWKKELDYKLAAGEYDRLRVAEAKELLEYKVAAAQLKERTIAAPFDGVIAKIHVRTGESVTVQQPLVRIVNVHHGRFVTYTDSVSGPRLAKGMKVPLRIDGAGGPVPCPGVVEFVSPVVDPSSGLREVKVLFENVRGAIQPGVTGSLLAEESHDRP